MGFVSRVKHLFNPSTSDSSDHQHQQREPADPIEEQAETDETVPRHGFLSPKASGLGPMRRFPITNPAAADATRSEANPEDDGAAAMLIEQERKDAEYRD